MLMKRETETTPHLETVFLKFFSRNAFSFSLPSLLSEFPVEV